MIELIAAAILARSPTVPSLDSLETSFGFFGCNRIEKDDWKSTKEQNPSSANVHQLEQTFRDLASIRPAPRFVFGGGDLVLGYGNDQGEETLSQLTAWKTQFYQSPLAGKTTMIPFPGNHELNKKVDKLKLPNPPTVAMWNQWYSGSGFRQMAANGPAAQGSNPDRLLGDQRKLNYSFDAGSVHFIVLNTDTLTSEEDPETHQGRVGWIPAYWASADIIRAQKNPRIRSIFLLGHRNLTDPKTTTGDSPIAKEPGQVLLNNIRINSKVRAYVCAHVHAWDLTNFGGTSKAWQVIAGNGGSKLEDDWKPKDGTYFGFVVLNVYRSGKVVLRNFRRPTPAGKYDDYQPEHPAPAIPVDTVLFDPSK